MCRYEAEFVRKFDTVRLPPGDIYYIVSTKWIDSWKRFVGISSIVDVQLGSLKIDIRGEGTPWPNIQ